MSWNRLEVIIDPARDIKPNRRPGYLPIEIRIDGRDLIEIVREVELPFAIRAWDEREPAERYGERGARAGAYSHLHVKDVLASPLGLLEKPEAFYDRGKSRVLQCSCRSFGCSDLLARVSLDDTRVTWSDFEQISADRSGRRPWGHEQLGPFWFERSTYAAALAACKDHYCGPRLVPE